MSRSSKMLVILCRAPGFLCDAINRIMVLEVILYRALRYVPPPPLMISTKNASLGMLNSVLRAEEPNYSSKES